MKRSHVLISKLVQGVAFRAWTRRTAQALQLTGWVRNTPEGRVEAVFEGEDAQVELMERQCTVGPPLARVRHIDVQKEEYRGEFTDFEILYDP